MRNLEADAAKCAKITDMFGAGAAAVAPTTMATAVPTFVQQQVEGGQVTGKPKKQHEQEESVVEAVSRE